MRKGKPRGLCTEESVWKLHEAEGKGKWRNLAFWNYPLHVCSCHCCLYRGSYADSLFSRLLINARGSVVMFQFEEVKWDRTLNYDRLTRKKEARKYDDISLRVKPSPNLQSERQKRLSKNTWKLYSTKKKMEKVSEEQVVVSYFISKKSAKGSRGSLGTTFCFWSCQVEVSVG